MESDLRLRLRVMTWLMRWSGLRIRDAVTLEKSRLHDDSLFLYQAKTGTPVYVPLPPNVVTALKELPNGPRPNPRYYFWSGNGDPKSAVANWQRAYRRLFEIAAIQKPVDHLNAAIRICFGTRLPWKTCLPEFPLIRFPCSWATHR